MKNPVLRETHHPHARRAAAERSPAPDTQTPADRYQELFVAVQSQRLFADSKTFVDCAPLQEPEAILSAYRAECGTPGFDLAGFVRHHFEAPEPAHTAFAPTEGATLREHIDALWPWLTRAGLLQSDGALDI